jgi:hypothetical protein
VIQTGGLPERLGALKIGAVDGAIVAGDMLSKPKSSAFTR